MSQQKADDAPEAVRAAAMNAAKQADDAAMQARQSATASAATSTQKRGPGRPRGSVFRAGARASKGSHKKPRVESAAADTAPDERDDEAAEDGSDDVDAFQAAAGAGDVDGDDGAAEMSHFFEPAKEANV